MWENIWRIGVIHIYVLFWVNCLHSKNILLEIYDGKQLLTAENKIWSKGKHKPCHACTFLFFYHLGVVAFPYIAPLSNLYSFFEETELNVINYNRGYHTAAWRYEFYFWLVKTVFFYEGAQLMSQFSCTSWSSQNFLPFIRRENCICSCEGTHWRSFHG